MLNNSPYFNEIKKRFPIEIWQIILKHVDVVPPIFQRHTFPRVIVSTDTSTTTASIKP